MYLLIFNVYLHLYMSLYYIVSTVCVSIKNKNTFLTDSNKTKLTKVSHYGKNHFSHSTILNPFTYGRNSQDTNI